MHKAAIEIFKASAALNREEKGRAGNLLHLPKEGKLVIAGDLHGNTNGYNQIVKYANLDENPNTHIIFQEIIHGGVEDFEGGCLSFKLLLEAAKLKTLYPDNVHFIMGNHDASTICGSEVLRGGKEMTGSMFGAIERCYGENNELVLLSMQQFLFSQPLAAKTSTGIFISHSLPADRLVNQFDEDVLNRRLEITDIVRPNSAYVFLWGRDHSSKLLKRMAQRLDAKLFVVGHQRQDEGFKRVEPNMLILACDHNRGSVVTIDLEKEYDLDSLCESVSYLIDLS